MPLVCFGIALKDHHDNLVTTTIQYWTLTGDESLDNENGG